MRQIKGTMVLTIVISIKRNKGKRDQFNRILSDRAKDLLSKRILSSTWYSFEAYKDCYDAMCHIEARNNPKKLNEWGQREAKRWLTTVYQASLSKGDPKLAIEKYSRFHRLVFNFGEYRPEFISDTEVDITYIDIPRDWENFYHSTTGWAQSFIELAIDKKVNFRFLNKSWQGNGWTKIKYSWSS
ncbi:MAG: hypothetical protein ACFFA0_10150 [Promethearchaeota archaeon]